MKKRDPVIDRVSSFHRQLNDLGQLELYPVFGTMHGKVLLESGLSLFLGREGIVLQITVDQADDENLLYSVPFYFL